VAEKMIQLENEKLAELVAQYLWRSLRWPSSFRTSPPTRSNKAPTSTSGGGAAIGGHLNGDELSHPKFDRC
jgi:hypothetical protein